MLPPGSTIGILGGGQLGRMLCLAAARLGLRTHVFAPEADGPAAQVAGAHTRAAFDDTDALARFAERCDALTYEWENVPVAAARAVRDTGAALHPNLAALRTAQDRFEEKEFLSALPGVSVAPFQAVRPAMDGGSVHELLRAVRYLAGPCVLKTRRGGYDGKGQAVIRTEADVGAAWERLGERDCVLECLVDFTREVSLVAARGADGAMAAYPLAENVHHEGVLRTSTAPAVNDTGAAATVARTIAEALDYRGVIAVEFFDTPQGLLVNEIAPRVHNSGHWTQDAGCTDQFENHVRAVAGWPLGSTVPRQAVRMTNLIGEDAARWGSLAAGPAHMHLYGKTEARPGRKMGHVNEIIG